MARLKPIVLTVLEDLDELATPSAMSKDISRELELDSRRAGKKRAMLGLSIRKISSWLFPTTKSGYKRRRLHLRCWLRGLTPDRSMERFFYNAFGQPAARVVLPLVDTLDLELDRLPS